MAMAATKVSTGITVLDLPTELVCQVAANLSASSDLKSLRSACSKLNLALEPFLFSHIRIDGKTTRLLEDLASGHTRAGQYVRNLDIGSLKLDEKDAGEEMESILAFRRCWVPALSALKSLGSIDWTVNEKDSHWALEQAINSLSQVHTISTIRLYLRGVWTNPVIHPLRQICHFKHLESCSIRVDDNRLMLPIAEGLFDVNSTHLKRLELDGGLDAWTDPDYCITPDTDLSLLFDSGAAPKLDILRLSQFSLSHSSHILSQLGSLKALHLDRCIPYDFWSVFSATNIQLREVTVDYVDRHFLDYLGSYRGLERIRLSFNGIQLGTVINDSAAERFYMECLPGHSASLKSINIIPKSTGRWCLNADNARVLRQCRGLEDLTIGINIDDVIVKMEEVDHNVGSDGSNGGIVTELLHVAKSYRCLNTLVVVLKGNRLPWDLEATGAAMERFRNAVSQHAEYVNQSYELHAVTRVKPIPVWDGLRT
ncbi:hypothetical protein AAF712_015967 [Marasmius tenuissimus]|uniref:F-box domain-containing protein n=1 Tax=Marasmius tenuissimus TaxID=585030 RepID=A0ABR2Z9F4_9AGAR